jgi:hypothetical protein
VIGDRMMKSAAKADYRRISRDLHSAQHLELKGVAVRAINSMSNLRHAYSSDARFREAVPAKTGPIIALYAIFSRHLVSKYPLKSVGSTAVRMILKTLTQSLISCAPHHTPIFLLYTCAFEVGAGRRHTLRMGALWK